MGISRLAAFFDSVPGFLDGAVGIGADGVLGLRLDGAVGLRLSGAV